MNQSLSTLLALTILCLNSLDASLDANQVEYFTNDQENIHNSEVAAGGRGGARAITGRGESRGPIDRANVRDININRNPTLNRAVYYDNHSSVGTSTYYPTDPNYVPYSAFPSDNNRIIREPYPN